VKKVSKGSLIKLALLVGGVTVAAKLVAAKKDEWQGLTEPEVREKLESRLPDRVPEEKRAAVADKVVAKMRNRGLITDAVDAVADTAEEEAEELDSVEDADDESPN
jgi:hypothetical protein